MELVADKAMAKCDEVDGLKDGIIDDPRTCSFDPARDVPACQCRSRRGRLSDPRAGGGGEEGLQRSGQQRKAVLLWLHGRQRGDQHGTERRTASGWANAIIAAQPDAKPADFNLAEGVMRYLILDPPQPQYDSMKFDYDRDTKLVERWSKLADAKDPDLSKFRKSGGKLIMTYGWADQILQPLMGVKYYEDVVCEEWQGQH